MWENIVRKNLDLRGLKDKKQREDFLVTSLARTTLVLNFVSLDSMIRASQLDLLQYLKEKPEGAGLSTVREVFYQPAATQYPDFYADKPFSAWLRFLDKSLVVTVDKDVVKIDDIGAEYLNWRNKQNRPAKVLLCGDAPRISPYAPQGV